MLFSSVVIVEIILEPVECRRRPQLLGLRLVPLETPPTQLLQDIPLKSVRTPMPINSSDVKAQPGILA